MIKKKVLQSANLRRDGFAQFVNPTVGESRSHSVQLTSDFRIAKVVTQKN